MRTGEYLQPRESTRWTVLGADRDLKSHAVHQRGRWLGAKSKTPNSAQPRRATESENLRHRVGTRTAHELLAASWVFVPDDSKVISFFASQDIQIAVLIDVDQLEQVELYTGRAAD